MSVFIYPEFQHAYSGKYMSHIIGFLIFDCRWKIFLRPVIRIIGEIGYFSVAFINGNLCYYMIQLLKLLFCKIRELIDSLDITCIEFLFVMKNDIIVCLIEYKLSVCLLNWSVFLCILSDIEWVRLGIKYVFLSYSEVYHKNRYQYNCKNDEYVDIEQFFLTLNWYGSGW